MLVWVGAVLAAIVMGKAAEMDQRSPLLWGLLTFLFCVVVSLFLRIGLLVPIVGLGVSFILMLILNLAKKPR